MSSNTHEPLREPKAHRVSTLANAAPSRAAPVVPALAGHSSVLAARERQIVLLEGLASLANQQRALLQGEDLSQLPELLSQRQLLIDELVSLDVWCGAQSSAAAAGSEGAQRRVRELAEQVRTQDEADLQLMQSRMQAATRELAELRGSSRALGAYGHAGGHIAGPAPLAQDTMG